jgi:hypothetical protein
MNPGKRRKIQKREFLMKRVQENKNKLSKELNQEEPLEVVASAEEVVQEVVKELEPVIETEPVQEVKTTKKRK